MTNVYDYLGVGFGPSNLSLAIARRLGIVTKGVARVTVTELEP